MIDLHLHLLPGVDDGASSLDVSADMLVLAESFGYTTLVATPHLDGQLQPSYEAKVRHAYALVVEKAGAVGTGIDVKYGYEIQLAPDLPRRLANGEQSTLAGSETVLVELPFAGWPNFAEQTLFDLQALGVRVLLAHPERYSVVQADIAKVLDLVDRGVMLQVTTGSLAGLFGKSAQRIAEELLQEDAATVLASDAHSAGQRFVAVADGLKRAEQIIGGGRTRQLVADNPRALLANGPLPSPATIIESSSGERPWKKVLGRFRG